MITKTRNLSLFAVAFVVGVALMTSAPFGQSASAARYGSIAFSEDSGAWGYSHGYSSRSAAKGRALRACRARGDGCRIVVWFRNACGALAVGRGNVYGWSWNTSRARARRRALAECRARTSGCRIRVTVCSR